MKLFAATLLAAAALANTEATVKPADVKPGMMDHKGKVVVMNVIKPDAKTPNLNSYPMDATHWTTCQGKAGTCRLTW